MKLDTNWKEIGKILESNAEETENNQLKTIKKMDSNWNDTKK